MSGAPCAIYCSYCAERISKGRDLEEVSMEFMSHCSNCGNYGQVVRYRVGKSHSELARRRAMQQARNKNTKVGGERGRAERRAR